MLHNSKYSLSLDHDEDCVTYDILDHALNRVQGVVLLSLSEPISADDDATFSAKDRKEEEAA